MKTYLGVSHLQDNIIADLVAKGLTFRITTEQDAQTNAWFVLVQLTDDQLISATTWQEWQANLAHYQEHYR